MNHINVVAAIIVNNNKILCTQRGISKYPYLSKKFEFPGGKIEEGETKEQAIIREVYEELRLKICIDREFTVVNHTYPDFTITLHSFLCSANSIEIFLSEHLSYFWLEKDQLNNLDWAAADQPIVSALLR